MAVGRRSWQRLGPALGEQVDALGLDAADVAATLRQRGLDSARAGDEDGIRAALAEACAQDSLKRLIALTAPGYFATLRDKPPRRTRRLMAASDGPRTQDWLKLIETHWTRLPRLSDRDFAAWGSPWLMPLLPARRGRSPAVGKGGLSHAERVAVTLSG